MSKTSISRTMSGKVISNKMNKTIVIEVTRQIQHAKYGKYLKRRSKIHAHDENNECQIGDIVQIKETKPISKTKAWVLVNIVEKAQQVETVA